MNTYEITFTRENGTVGTDRFTVPTEGAARKNFYECYCHGNTTVTKVDLIRSYTPATKEQERKAMTIKVNKMWNSDDVRTACICNNLYTNGNNTDYSKMLAGVRELEPTTENIYRVAKDIYEHSKGQTISNIMYILENDVVRTTFEIEGEE